MDMTFTEEQRRARDEVAAFLESESGRFQSACDNWITGWDRDFSRKLAERGWIGITWPTRYGGQGSGYVDRLAVTEVLLAAGAPLASHWFADRQMAPAILAHGTEAQKERYLPEIRAGDATYCIGMSEPQAGSDLAAVRTRAVRSERGWRLTGHKIWTSLAQRSDYIYLLARTDPAADRHGGLSEFVVPLRSEGITVSPIDDMSGARHFNEVFLEEVWVPADALIGAEGGGWAQVTGQLAYERAGLERVMSVWPLLLAMRKQAGDDGRRLEELGEIEAAVIVARQLVYRAAAVADTGRPPDHEAALAKLFGTQIEQRIVEVASRWAGRASRLAPTIPGAALSGHLFPAWLIAPSFTIRGGTSEILTGVVARRVLGLAS